MSFVVAQNQSGIVDASGHAGIQGHHAQIQPSTNVTQISPYSPNYNGSQERKSDSLTLPSLKTKSYVSENITNNRRTGRTTNQKDLEKQIIVHNNESWKKSVRPTKPAKPTTNFSPELKINNILTGLAISIVVRSLSSTI